jgi:plasmid maintenance system antidote protein VapI
MLNSETFINNFNPDSIDLVLAELGISAAELARKIGLSHRNQVTKIKKGQRQLTGSELIRLCKFANKEISFFEKV